MRLGNLVITGGLGFIGSHFVRQILSNESKSVNSVFNIDFMGYGSNPANLKDVSDIRYEHIRTNISNKNELESVVGKKDIDMIVNFAAQTHVDRSISDPKDFVDANIIGVFSLLEFCRSHDVELFVQISTDEVYGDAKYTDHFDEASPLRPNNPYSASKASADLLTRAYNKTYGIKTIITRCSNNYGSNQYPEKLIPKSIIRIIKDLPIQLYGDGKQIREWIYVKDHVNAINRVISDGKPGEIYNITSSCALSNVELVTRISEIMYRHHRARNIRIEYVQDRPGHDRRYALNSSKIKKELEWKPEYSFDLSLEETVKWYIQNEWWWSTLLNSHLG